MKILWLSRHAPLSAQVSALKALWPGCWIDHDPQPFGDATDIVRRIDRGGYAETVVVAPLSVIDHLCRNGLRPLRAEMEEVKRLTDPSREVAASGRIYRFREFRRIVRLELVTEPVVGEKR